MGLVVRTNLPALNAGNSLSKSSKSQNKTMKKLASGYKINSAADDASGLSISEKMRNQITALDTATENCEDGINLLQTAEGYYAELHDIVNRMTELAEKSANGVLDTTDRDALQDEMDELCAEVDRIATTANFNSKKLIDGSLGTNRNVKIFSDKFEEEISILKPTNKDFLEGEFITTDKLKEGVTYQNAHPGDTLQHDSYGNILVEVKDADGNVHEEKMTIKDGDKLYIPIGATKPESLNGVEVELNAPATEELIGTYDAKKHGWYDQYNRRIDIAMNWLTNEYQPFHRGIGLQVGESSTSADQLFVSLNSMHSDSLFKGLDGFINTTADYTNQESTAKAKIVYQNDFSSYKNAVTIDITDKDSASAAADGLKQISTYISSERGKIGAFQNRLEHTLNNLTTASENTTAAHSRIKDTDMAKEMMEYTSKNVITQAAQSMLAQANTQPQNVLSLLQQ